MPIGREFASLLGVSEDASESEVAARRRALAEFYDSGNVPPALHQWAQQQAMRLVEAQSTPLAAGVGSDGGAVEPNALRRQGGRKGRLLDRLLTSWIVLGSLILAAVVAGAVVAKLDLLGVQASEPERAIHSTPPVPLDSRRIAELSRLAEQNPLAADALRELGETYFVAGQWQRAIEWLTQLLTVDATDVHALTEIGTASFNAGRKDDAKAFWLAGLALAPDDPMLHYSLGHFYMSVVPADPAAARREWQRVLQVAPDSSLATAAQSRLDAMPAK